MSSSFDLDDFLPSPTAAGANDIKSNNGNNVHHQQTMSDIYQQPSTPDMDTPKMSQRNARSLILDTPPLILNTIMNTTSSHLPSVPSFCSQATPTYMEDTYDPLEPPAWRPPEADEIEYVDSWNNSYNNQHHYLQPGYHKDDSSTICSSQTNNSFTGGLGSIGTNNKGQQTLRPRGLSITSYGSQGRGHSRNQSVGSCPQPPPRHGHGSHHRHDSLPVSLFSSLHISQQAQSHPSQGHPLLAQQSQQPTPQSRLNKQAIGFIQPRKETTPYEMHSHINESQVQADAALAGLEGILVDLYVIDRCVDGATARMLATHEEDDSSSKSGGVADIFRLQDGKEKDSSSRTASQKQRKTSVGTLQDIQTILELHRVDKMVDRFKQGLQMPVFFEEEAWETTVWKELRKVDLEVDAAYRKERQDTKENYVEEKGDMKKHRQNSKHMSCQFDLSEDEEEEDWDTMEGDHGGIYLSTDSFIGGDEENDPYAFHDPHEMDALRSNVAHHSLAAATSDDLRFVIDLLRTDVEIDGASRRHKEFEMVRPLLEVDQMMEKSTVRMNEKSLQSDLQALYLIDLEVDAAKSREPANKSRKTENGGSIDVPTVNSDEAVSAKGYNIQIQEDAELPATGDNISQVADLSEASKDTNNYEPAPSSEEELSDVMSLDKSLEVKNMLTQHIPQVSQLFCPTSPDFVPSHALSQEAVPSVSLPPPPPMASPEPSSKRSIFSYQEKLNNNMIPSVGNQAAKIQTTTPKRSIFSKKEKSSAARAERGALMPGTTIVTTQGGEMIDDIPIGKVVLP